MKIVFKVLLLLITVSSVICGFILNFKLSDAISFYIGVIAILVSIVSLSIADKKEKRIDFSLLVLWNRNEAEWYDVRFKLVNDSKSYLYNLTLTLALPVKCAINENNQLRQIFSVNKRVYQYDMLKVFPKQEFEYVFDIKIKFSEWNNEEIQFTITGENHISKTIKIGPELIKKLINANTLENAVLIK
jgi:hypothetical protein